MTKKKIAILYGGRSVEHDISILSAKNIVEQIDKTRFDVFLIGISKTGSWYKTDSVSSRIEQGIPLSFTLTCPAPAFHFSSQAYTPDMVFPVLHGTDGEDGAIQGMMKAFGLPLVGCDVLGSALAMNKAVAKQVLQQAGLPVVPFRVCHFFDKEKPTYAALTKELGNVFMVKAASLGSSVGIYKVKSEAEYNDALRNAFQFDQMVLFEKFLRVREIECAVLGNHPPQASLPGEIVVHENYEFYDFTAKYVDKHAVDIRVPAMLSDNLKEKIRTLSVQAFQALHGRDFARVDLFVTDNEDIFINEINTIPGFTNSSMFPMMWKERGISFTDLITKLIESAFAKHEDDQRINRQFASSLTV